MRESVIPHVPTLMPPERAEFKRKQAEGQAGLDAIRRREEDVRAAPLEAHQKKAKAKQERVIPEAKLMERTAEAERAAREKLERANAKRKATIERKKQESSAWTKNLAGLGNVTVLKRLGLLLPDWSGDVPAYSAAKKEFFHRFASLKKGEAEGSEKSKPNAHFFEVFPTEESLRSPTAEDADRGREMGIGAKMDVAAE
jgi:hypothetical protein